MLAQARTVEIAGSKESEPVGSMLDEDLERRLENLSNILEKQFAAEDPARRGTGSGAEADKRELSSL